MLKLYNSLARASQDFVPIEPGHVRMYVCGMTVYDYCHLGHARVMVVFDMVARWLRASGYRVTYVRNITDIDDKIIKRARENGEIAARPDRPLHRLHARGRRRAGRPATRCRTARHRIRAADARHDRPAREQWLRLCRRQSRCLLLGAQVCRLRQALRQVASRTCAPASASMSRRASRIRSISCSGSAPRKASPTRRSGSRRGAVAGRAGTSNARR